MVDKYDSEVESSGYDKIGDGKEESSGIRTGTTRMTIRMDSI